MNAWLIVKHNNNATNNNECLVDCQI